MPINFTGVIKSISIYFQEDSAFLPNKRELKIFIKNASN